ncbi:MAG: CBS domain-containing protein [Thauera sp.]|jgi:CBS domain-containing protein|nr:CBS domain-containing protein [Thauera sp.]
MTNRTLSTIIAGQQPVMMRPGDNVQAACKRMCESNVGAVLVTDARQHLLGIFTGRDAVQAIADGLDPATTRLEQMMTTNPDSLGPDARAVEALQMMCDGGYGRLPVVDGGKVVGIITRRDFKGLEFDAFEDRQDLWERIC